MNGKGRTRMKWLDGHCDVLWRIWEDPTKNFYENNGKLDVTYQRLIQSNVKLQVFAIFIPPFVRKGQRCIEAFKQIDIFYDQVIKEGKQIIPFQSIDEPHQCLSHRCTALLALEGAEAIEGNITLLRVFYRLGIRQVGLTWNVANEVADGILEERGGGLTQFGRELVKEMERLYMIVDVSHLSEAAFWEIIENVDLSIVASHSNCRAICPHKRNLTDEQIQALIQKKGLIGINFVPYFVSETKPTIASILRHLDYIASLGGEDSIFFGSDFDGELRKIPNLENLGQLHNLKNELLRRYPERIVRKWGFENGYRFYSEHLTKKD